MAGELLADGVLDNGLDYLTANGTRLDLCSAAPTDWSNMLTVTRGNKTGITVGSPEDGSSGRKVVIPAVTGGDVTSNGTCDYWALSDDVGELLVAGPLSAQEVLSTSNTWGLGAIDVTFPAIDPYTPLLPQLFVDKTLPTGWDGAADATITESGNDTTNGTNFAAALAAVDQTAGIYIIEITAGVNCVGQFTIPDGGGTDDWLIIRTSQHSGTLPASGTRVVDNTGMAKLSSTTNDSQILHTATGCHNVRIIGVEIAQESIGATINYGFVRVINGATKIHFDRCFIHIAETEDCLDGVYCYECGEVAIFDSRVEGVCMYSGAGQTECHAVWLHKATGPVLIQNNYLSASGMGFMTGGVAGHPNDAATLTQDLTVRGNHLFKDDAWRVALDNPGGGNDGLVPLVKNHLELKEGTRVLIEGNRLEHCWPGSGSQYGVSLVIKADQGATSDVTVRNNFSLDSDWGITISGKYDLNRVLIENNLFLKTGRTGTPSYGDYARTLFISFGETSASTVNTVRNITARNNTFHDPGANPLSLMYFDTASAYVFNFTLENNLFASGASFLVNGGQAGYAACDITCNGYLVNNNLVRHASTYSTNATFLNWTYVADDAAILWTNGSGTLLEIADFELQSTSPGATAQTGLPADLGANMTTLAAAIND